MGSETALEVIFPVARVSFICGEPMHDTVAVTLIVFPCSFVKVATSVGHLSLAPFHTTLPLALVDRTVVVGQLTVAVPHTVQPCSFVNNAFLLIGVLSLSMTEAIEYMSDVSAAIFPGIVALAGDLVLFEFSFVLCAISPFECTSAVKETSSQLTLVFMAIFELTSALPMVNMADLLRQ